MAAANIGPNSVGGDQMMEIDCTSARVIKVEESSQSLLTTNAAGHHGVTQIITLGKSQNFPTGTSQHIVVAPVSPKTEKPMQHVTINKSIMTPMNTVANVVTVSPQKVIVPRTPLRHMLTSKMSPVKSPTKITMIPIGSGIKSPQKILQPGQIVTMVSQAGLTALPQNSNINTKTITVSPSKVFLQGQPDSAVSDLYCIICHGFVI